MTVNTLMVSDNKTELSTVLSKDQLERIDIPFMCAGDDQITSVMSVGNMSMIFY